MLNSSTLGVFVSRCDSKANKFCPEFCNRQNTPKVGFWPDIVHWPDELGWPGFASNAGNSWQIRDDPTSKTVHNANPQKELRMLATNRRQRAVMYGAGTWIISHEVASR
jgi:hypothetical protein